MRVFDVVVKGIIRQSVMYQETYMEIDYKTKMCLFLFYNDVAYINSIVFSL
jgi:hypothetical protein